VPRRVTGRRALAALGLLPLTTSCILLSWLSGALPTPVSTRPDFKPDPRAPVALLDARPERVTLELQTLVPAESLDIVGLNVRDGYVETAWYDPVRHRSYRRERDIPDLPVAVKIRCWADPWVPGQTRLTVEPVYRPRLDPSRTERDLEVIVPSDGAGYKIAEKLIASLKEKLGTPPSAR
jgi:hypothetical protein